MTRELIILYGAVILILVISIGRFFSMLKRKKQDFRLLVVVSVLIALSVAGRLIFAITPGFKPVTAMVIISGLYFGGETGFLTGALTAFISNFYFGQGPWTPFQMIIWGCIGGMAGLGSSFLRERKFVLYFYSAIAGIIYSLFMDFYTVLWVDGYFNGYRYLTAIAAALPHTMLYVVSNVIFMILLKEPIGRKLMRVRKKFGFDSQIH